MWAALKAGLPAFINATTGETKSGWPLRYGPFMFLRLFDWLNNPKGLYQRKIATVDSATHSLIFLMMNRGAPQCGQLIAICDTSPSVPPAWSVRANPSRVSGLEGKLFTCFVMYVEGAKNAHQYNTIRQSGRRECHTTSLCQTCFQHSMCNNRYVS